MIASETCDFINVYSKSPLLRFPVRIIRLQSSPHQIGTNLD